MMLLGCNLWRLEYIPEGCIGIQSTVTFQLADIFPRNLLADKGDNVESLSIITLMTF